MSQICTAGRDSALGQRRNIARMIFMPLGHEYRFRYPRFSLLQHEALGAGARSEAVRNLNTQGFRSAPARQATT